MAQFFLGIYIVNIVYIAQIGRTDCGTAISV